MKHGIAVLLALALSCGLAGCAAGQGTVVYQETVSPNEAYVASEGDIVYYTLTVSQDAGYDITVRAESNFAFFDPVSYYFFKIFFQVLSDHKDDFVKSRLDRVIDGVIHNDLPIRAYRSELLDPAAKTASDPCRHDHKCCF